MASDGLPMELATA